MNTLNMVNFTYLSSSVRMNIPPYHLLYLSSVHMNSLAWFDWFQTHASCGSGQKTEAQTTIHLLRIGIDTQEL